VNERIKGRCGGHLSLAERLTRRVDSSGGPDVCWPFSGTLVNGYGTIWSGGAGGKMLKAHRVAWETSVGPLPSDTSVGARGTLVLHRCDNRVCCNPAHLFLGTQLDNMRDMEAKGRTAKRAGSANGNAKLLEADVLRIRERCGKGETRTAVAADYGMTSEAIGLIASGKTWKHLRNVVTDQFCRLEDGE
jgi:hypothetical protein